LNRYSVIDIGTNSILYLLVEISDEDRLHSKSQELYNVRLGKGVENNRRIDNTALDHCIEILNKLKKLARKQQSDKLIVVGTEVFRKAENRVQILKRIRAQTGLEIKLLSEKEEAEASFLGAVVGNNLKGENCVVDIGGGSSEIIFGKGREVIDSISIPMGAVGLTEEFLKTDPPQEREILDLENKVIMELKKYSCSILSSCSVLIGVGGTITTAAAIHFNLTQYDPDVIQGKVLRLSEITTILNRLYLVSLSERKNILDFDPERADIIIAGMIILKSIMKTGNFQSIRISDSGLRFGLALKELTS